jgi:hypothetical protein
MNTLNKSPVGAKRFALPLLVSAAVCSGVLLLLIYQLSVQDTRFVDLRYIWFAGKMWSEGLTPYGPAYAARAATDFPDWISKLQWWLYPPCWYPIAVTFAQMPVVLAHRVGSTIALLTTIVGSWMIWRSANVRKPQPDWYFFAILAFILFASTTTAMVRQVVPTFAAQFGLALIIVSLITPNRMIMTIGIALSMFKPQIGLPACAALVFIQGSWRPLAVAAFCDIALSAPAFMIQSPLEIGRAVAELSQRYTTADVNGPENMTGVAFFLAKSGVHLGIGPSIVLAMILCALVGVIARTRFANDSDTARHICAFAIPCVISATVSMHPSDHVTILMVLPLALRFAWKRAISCAICYLLIWRAENLMRLLHLEAENSIGFLSAGSIGLMLVSFFNAFFDQRNRKIGQASDLAPSADNGIKDQTRKAV